MTADIGAPPIGARTNGAPAAEPAAPDRHRRGFLRASMSVGAWTLVSRATGFVRLAVIGAVLGPTFLGNLFQTANQLPNLAFELVAGQLIASLLLPALVGHLDRGDRAAGERVAGGFLGVIVATFAAAAAVLALIGPFVAGLLSVGVDDAGTRAGLVHLGWPLIAVVMPQLVLYGFIGVANAVQNAGHRFALAAAAPALENLIVVAAVVAFGRRVGAGADVGAVTVADVVLLGAGSTLGVVVHAGLQWFGARRVGIRLRPRAGWRDPEVRAIVRLAAPSMILAALTAAQTFACLVVVGSVAGGVVAFQLGLAFVATAVALGARPLTVAALPDLARQVAARDLGAFRAAWDRTLSVSILVLAPAAVGLAALAPALGRFLGLGAMSGDEAVLLLIAALAGLALAVLGEGISSFANQAAYTRRDGRAPLQGAIVRTALLAAGLGVVLRLDDPAVVVVGTGLAFSLATVLSAWFVTWAVAQDLPPGRGLGRQVGEAVAVAAAAAVPAVPIMLVLTTLGGPAGRVLPLAVGGAVFGGGYLLVQQRFAHLLGRAPLLARLRHGDATDAAPLATDPAPTATPSRTGTRTRTGGEGDGRRIVALRRVSRSAAAGTALLAAAVGPAAVNGDGRWLLLSTAALVVLSSAAQPQLGVYLLLGAGPIVATVDVLVGTSITLPLVLAVAAGVLISGAARRARHDVAWRMRLGWSGWAGLLGTGLLAASVGLLAGEATAGLRLAVIVIGTAGAMLDGLTSFAALRRATRLAATSSIACLPAVPLLTVSLGWVHPSAADLLGVMAAPAAAMVALAMGAVCRRQRVAATPAVLALAGVVGASAGWLALVPVTVGIWLTVRYWPNDTDPLVPTCQETGPTQRPAVERAEVDRVAVDRTATGRRPIT
ncbi:MAG: lipid II flippase MurJ [Acidimicrobiales bacterium]